MAEDSDTLTVRMLRVSGKNKETQWFEYRPSFRVDIVRIEWELDTMVVELDTAIADYLLRAGYAAPLPQGSAPPSVPAEQYLRQRPRQRLFLLLGNQQAKSPALKQRRHHRPHRRGSNLPVAHRGGINDSGYLSSGLRPRDFDCSCRTALFHLRCARRTVGEMTPLYSRPPKYE